MPSRRQFDPHRIFHDIKFYAVEVAALIVFLVWLYTAVVHEVKNLLRSDSPPTVQAAEVHESCRATLPMIQ